jgi:hypothetical protein
MVSIEPRRAMKWLRRNATPTGLFPRQLRTFSQSHTFAGTPINRPFFGTLPKVLSNGISSNLGRRPSRVAEKPSRVVPSKEE